MPAGAQLPHLERQVRNLIARIEALERKRPEVPTRAEDEFDQSAVTVILDGEGPPDVELGDLGDYYLDTLNHILYGPKSLIVGGELLPEEFYDWAGSPDIDSGVYNVVAIRVRFRSAGQVTGIRYKRTASVGVGVHAMRFRIWEEGIGVVTADQTDADTDGWFTVAMGPYTIDPDKYYDFGYYRPDDGDVFRGSTYEAPIESDNIEFVFYSLAYSSGEPPNVRIDSRTHYITPVFEPITTGTEYWPIGLVSVPTGGATSESLTKTSGDDWDLDWT